MTPVEEHTPKKAAKGRAGIVGLEPGSSSGVRYRKIGEELYTVDDRNTSCNKLSSTARGVPGVAELHARLKELEEEYRLAQAGLAKGMVGTLGAMVSGLATLGAALVAFLVSGPGFLSGTHLVIIFATLAAAVILYFSFVFGRTARLRAAITKTKKEIELSTGERVR